MAAGNIDEQEDGYDEAPTFIDMNSAVEVGQNGADDEAMMEDEAMMDDNDAEEIPSKMPITEGIDAASASSQPIVDQSKATFSSHTDAVYAVASHYDVASHSLSIASGGGDDRAYLHHITTKDGAQQTSTTPLSHPHADSVSCLAFNAPFVSADVSGKVQRNLLGVGSYDGSIVLYDALNGALDQVLEGPSDVEFLSFHPRGGTVLLAGSIADGTVWMYHLPSKSCLQVFVGHEGGVTAGSFTPDGKSAVSAGRDGTLRVWAPKTGMSRHVFRLMEHQRGEEEGPGLTSLAVGGGADGQMAICGGEDGNAYIVHVSGKKLLATLTHFEESKDANSSTNSNAKNQSEMDDEDMGEVEPRSVEAVGFCPTAVHGTAGWCATGGVDGALKIWNTSVTGGTGAQLRHKCVREDGPGVGITRLRWHATLPLVICAYTDGVVGTWDARTGTMAGAPLTGHGDMINDMSVGFVEGSDVAVVVTGSDDRTVKMFEYQPY